MSTETILSLPFVYEAKFVRPRHRNITTELVRDTLPVMVTVATGDEAPVAFELDWSGRHDVPRPPLVTRIFEGRLFRAIVDTGGLPVPLETFQADMGRPARDWRATWLGDRKDRPSWGGDQYPTLPPLRGSQFGRRDPMRLMDLAELAEDVAEGASKFRLKGTDRDVRASEAQAFLGRNLVCIDGGMWTTNYAVEPYWGVHDGKVSFSVDRDPLWYVTPFRLDRLEEAVGLATLQGGGPPAARDVPKVTIPNAGLLARDEGVMLARQLLSGIGWQWEAASRREGWGAEAEALRAGIDPWCKGEMDLTGAANLLEGFGRLREVLADFPPEGYPAAAQIVERTGAALGRWSVMRASRPDMTALAVTAEDDEMAFATLSP